MKFQAAEIREQGVSFAVVSVKKRVIDDRTEAQKVQRAFATIFRRKPIVLMAQDAQGTPVYYGRSDIVRFMATVPFELIRWSEYTVRG